MYSGLDGNDLTRRYIRTHVEGLLRLIARECRALEGRKAAGEPSQAEMELVWHLHSTVIYYLVRKHIFRTATVKDTQRARRDDDRRLPVGPCRRTQRRRRDRQDCATGKTKGTLPVIGAAKRAGP